jgi:M6 family metalloprotease-like protein
MLYLPISKHCLFQDSLSQRGDDMNTKHRLSKFTGILVALGLLLSLAVSTVYAQGGVEGQTWSQSGWFSITWGDSTGGESQAVYTLTDNSRQTTVLLIDERLAQSLGGVLSFNRKYVSVQGVWAAPLSAQGAPTVLNVTSLSIVPLPGTNAPNGVSPAVIGSKPWITIMCKFSDFPALEPNNLAYFLGMYSSTKPGLDHYWRELSYNTANVTGSAASGWFTLPHTEVFYNPTDTEKGTNLTPLGTDCINAADPSVDFSPYSGINMMFNTDFDNGWAWGGSMNLTLDGVTKVWSTTWEPPWSYADISVIEHEMGHGFGLPHSSYNPAVVYDNVWDVMSADRYNCAASTDPTYGCMAQHTISYHKDILGWIPGGAKFTVGLGTIATITLDQLAVLPGAGNFLMAQVPIGGSGTHFYSVEARRVTGSGYDVKLPGNAVIIHEVDTTRGIPALLIDATPGDTSDAGARWTVGEVFFDAVNNIFVTVISATPTGFQVLIVNGIADIIPPVVTVPANMTEEATGPGGRVVSFSATATDTVGPTNPAVTCNPPSGSMFPLGTTTVTCSATDAAGNTGTISFTIQVRDTTAPNLTVPANMIGEATGAAGRIVTFSATATDLVDATPTVACVAPSGSTFPLGTTTVNCTATDDAGNVANGSFTITVVDTNAPTLNLPANFAVAQSIPAGAFVSFSATATDTVAPLNPTVTCIPASGSVFPVGTTTVNCSATDTAANTANGSFQLTVNAGTQLLKNPGFLIPAFPTPWKPLGITPPYSRVMDCVIFLSSNCSVHLTGSARNVAQAGQQILILSGLAGDKYSFGLWSRAQTVPVAGLYKVELMFYNNFGRVIGIQTLSFNTGTHGFELAYVIATAPANFSRIGFRFTFQKTSGEIWFDDAFLFRIP